MFFPFPFKVRSTISDFAVFLTIVIMVLIDYLVGVPSPKLHVPEKFEVRKCSFEKQIYNCERLFLNAVDKT